MRPVVQCPLPAEDIVKLSDGWVVRGLKKTLTQEVRSNGDSERNTGAIFPQVGSYKN